MIFGRSAAESMPCGRRPADAVKVGAQPNVVHSRNLGDVIDVVDQRLQRRPRNLRHPLALDAVQLDVVDRLAFAPSVCSIYFCTAASWILSLRLIGLAEVLVDRSR